MATSSNQVRIDALAARTGVADGLRNAADALARFTALGGAAGAAIGNNTGDGDAERGAAIGAAAGAIAGTVTDDNR